MNPERQGWALVGSHDWSLPGYSLFVWLAWLACLLRVYLFIFSCLGFLMVRFALFCFACLPACFPGLVGLVLYKLCPASLLFKLFFYPMVFAFPCLLACLPTCLLSWFGWFGSLWFGPCLLGWFSRFSCFFWFVCFDLLCFAFLCFACLPACLLSWFTWFCSLWFVPCLLCCLLGWLVGLLVFYVLFACICSVMFSCLVVLCYCVFFETFQPWSKTF